MRIRTIVGARRRSTPEIKAGNIIETYQVPTVLNVDQSAVDQWWAVLDGNGPSYVHKSVAVIIADPIPLPEGIYPYFSQEDMDAKQRPDDCGEANVKMVLAHAGIIVSTDSLKVREPSGMSSCQDLVKLFDNYGLKAATLAVAAGSVPPQGAICLLNANEFGRDYVLSKKFIGQHFVLFLWEDHNAEPVAVVHDPNFYGDARMWGAYHRYPLEQFDRAMTNCDPSRNCVVLV